MNSNSSKKGRFWHRVIVLFVAILFVSGGATFVWIATLKLPDVSNFNNRVVAESTKFFDRTGQIQLFNTYSDVQRTEIPLEDISPYVKNATIAVEDSEFYQHHGIKPVAILRAVFVNATSLSFSQGGSTITQQVVKNALLTKEKSISRKIKEWVLAIKLEKVLSKDQILSIYLNENPYGGNIYGVEEASQQFFGKSAHDLTLAESAYIASLPQAPSYYSPYGNHKKELDARKDFVLERMKDLKYINEDEMNSAKNATVTFRPLARTTALAPHFVFYLRDYLASRYGEEILDQGGLSVITTIDADLQKRAEELAKKTAFENKTKFDAENIGLVAIDPKTGQILAMVGSRDFFDKEIDGNFNVTLAKRQPGSSFKPFVYATAFKKGYTDKTVLFDVKTEFSARCSDDGKPNYEGAVCYSPNNYDNIFRGPVTMREALAQSLNIPAVKTLYLAGINDSISTAKDLGISTLNDPDRLGLTLVLGGGEVTLLEMTDAYSAFANDGVRNPAVGILKVTDASGNTLEEFKQSEVRGLDSNIARMLTNVLSDNKARAPAFGEQNALYFGQREVAAKTGTTNDYRDAWVIGYTPSLAVGAWAGNNDNRSMQKKVAGQIIAPSWHEYMTYALSKYPVEDFPTPDPIQNEDTLPPILRGIIPKENGVIHSILYWVNKDNPRLGKPTNPESDPQFSHWEYGINNWLTNNTIKTSFTSTETSGGVVQPVSFVSGLPSGAIPFSKPINFTVSANFGSTKVVSVSIYINGRLVGTLSNYPFYFSINPRDYGGFIKENNTLKVIALDENGGSTSKEYPLSIILNQ